MYARSAAILLPSSSLVSSSPEKTQLHCHQYYSVAHDTSVTRTLLPQIDENVFSNMRDAILIVHTSKLSGD